jgi:TetR/AcrR family transcriptional regulator, cholesterol catabolism regulator
MAERTDGKKSASQLSRRRKTAQEREGAGYAERRDKIIASAALAFQEAGYDATTLSDIAERAGTDRASIYYYASSKEELFQQVCSGMLEFNLAAAEEIAGRDIPAIEKLGLIMVRHLKTHEEGYPQWAVLVQEMQRITDAKTTWSRETVDRMRRYEAVVKSVIAEGIGDGTVRSDIPPDLAVHAIFGMLNWTHRWYRPGGQYDATVVGKIFATLAVNGLAVGR